MLESTPRRYRDGDLEDIQNVIDDLLDLGREMKEANDRRGARADLRGAGLLRRTRGERGGGTPDGREHFVRHS